MAAYWLGVGTAAIMVGGLLVVLGVPQFGYPLLILSIFFVLVAHMVAVTYAIEHQKK